MSAGYDKGYDDFVCFLDEDDRKITQYVKIIEVNGFVKFLTKGGAVIQIPRERMLKVKQRGDSQ